MFSNYFAFSRISMTRHLLSLDSGRVSITSTRSPTLHSFFSSCAFRRTVLLTIFLYSGCFTLSTIATTTVLSILSLTTKPTLVFLKFLSATVKPSYLLLCRQTQCCLYTSNVLFNSLNASCIFKLICCNLLFGCIFFKFGYSI